MLRGTQKGSESMRFHLLGTLFSFALSQGLGCASVSGVRAEKLLYCDEREEVQVRAPKTMTENKPSW